MMGSVDRYLGRRRTEEYDCLDFAREVWLELTGEDLSARLQGAIGSARRVERRHFAAFERLDAPADPCLVFMRHPRLEPHVGVYLRGRVLHLTDAGVEFQPPAVAARVFSQVRCYR